MREIKFRGKRIDSGEWVYGDVHFNADRSRCHIHQRGERVFESYDVFPESIGQFTGLKDKNGKEIYEGDIIEFQSGIKPQRTIIEFEIHCYNAGFYPKGGASAHHYWEVIGNLTDNPELLEK